jgi:glucokinase
VALEGRVVRGPRRILGEVGHVVVRPDSERRCGCGNFGCLETLVAKRAIIDAALYRLQQGRASLLLELSGGDPSQVSPELVAQGAEAGDALALEVYAEAGYWLGVAICSMIVLCDPDAVLLGGGIAAAGEALFGPVRRTVAQRSRISGFDPAMILPAELGNQAGMVGAAALVWEQLQTVDLA